MKAARIMELLVGVVFLVAAASKTYDMYGFAVQVGKYGIFPSDPETEMALAWVMTVIEAVIGAALIAGLHLRGMLLAGTAALLVVFSGLIAYGWAFHGLEDCGCFGATIQLAPGPSLIKNAILLAMTGYAWFELRKASPEVDRKLRSPALAAAGAALAAVFAVGLLGDERTVVDDRQVDTQISKDELKARPFAKFAFKRDDGTELNLREGRYLVAVLNATCEHCQASVAPLNEFATLPDSPPVVGLVLANEASEMDEFKAITSPLFETYTIAMESWFPLIKDKEPPAFYLVIEGADEGYLETLELTVDDLIELAMGDSEPGA